MNQDAMGNETYDGTDGQNVVPREQHRNEPDLRSAVVQTLKDQGIGIADRIVCATGEPDIVTADLSVVIELKWHLTNRNIKIACGQVLLYRAAINPDARALVVGYCTDETTALVPFAAAIGVEIVCWQDRLAVGEQSLGHGTSQTTPSTSPQTPTLRWAVRERAIAREITSVRLLAFATRTSRQNLYSIWERRGRSVSLAMLARLCHVLDANAGDWFCWQEDELVWNVRAIAEEVGIPRDELIWRAQILRQSLMLIWDDRQKFVFLDTLARLARALTTTSRAFNIGDLLIWQSPDEQPDRSQ